MQEVSLFSRSETIVRHRSRRQNDLWLCRVYHPRPNADNEAVTDFLMPLRGDEETFKTGRFINFVPDMMPHNVQVWFDHEDEDERQEDFETMVSWVRASNAPWSFEFSAEERIGVLFSFDDLVTSFMFMQEYGGAFG
jgi:hypothetical protein